MHSNAMHEKSARGRPLSPIGTALVDSLRQQPQTIEQVAQALQINVNQADCIVRRLQGNGQVSAIAKQPGKYRRSATVFAAKEVPAPDNSLDEFFKLIRERQADMA